MLRISRCLISLSLLGLVITGCEGGSNNSGFDSDSITGRDSDSSSDAVTDFESDSETGSVVNGYNGIPGTATGTCGYNYAPTEMVVNDSGDAPAGIRFFYGDDGNLVRVESDSPKTVSELSWDGYKLVSATHKEYYYDSTKLINDMQSTFEYNSDNLPVKWHLHYNGTEDFDARDVYYSITHEDGRLSKIEGYTCDTQIECPDIEESWQFSYDTSGKLEKIETLEEYTDFEYDDNDRLSLKETAANDSTVISRTAYSYNSEGFAQTKDTTLGTTGGIRTYQYEDGRLSQAEYVFEGGFYTTEYEFTDKTDACALMRTWIIPFFSPFKDLFSRERMIMTYGDGGPTNLFW